MTDELRNSKRYKDLFEKLVPVEGPAETVEGEMLRAISKIGYRYYNDGDYFHTGYGCKTAGPAHAFLVTHSPLKIELNVIFNSCGMHVHQTYKETIDNALETIVTYIEGRESYKPNSIDMYNCPPLYEDDEDEDEDEEEFWNE